MTLAHPEYISIGIVIILVWSTYYWGLRARPHIDLPDNYKKRRSALPMVLVYILGLAAWGVLTYAMMQPRIPLSNVKNTIKVNDIFFVVDVSKSMEAVDFKPNRLAVAKKKIFEFVSLRPTDRMGIIMFSEKPFTLLPLTLDHELVKKSVSDIVIGPLGSGTNIGDALSLAIARATFSKTKNKVIILLTDGVSMMGRLTPIQAAEEAAKKDIKIYSIGIGKKESKQVLRNNFGGFQNLPGGSVDLETLKKISEITGAKSYYAATEKGLEEVFSEIQELEKIEIKSHSKVIYQEKYLEYLWLGLILLTLTELSRKYVLRLAI